MRIHVEIDGQGSGVLIAIGYFWVGANIKHALHVYYIGIDKMDKIIVATFRVKYSLWETFGQLVERLKKQGILGPEESRGSIIQEFIAVYVVDEAKRMEYSTKQDLEGE